MTQDEEKQKLIDTRQLFEELVNSLPVEDVRANAPLIDRIAENLTDLLVEKCHN